MFQHGDIAYGDDGKLYDKDGNLITELYRPNGTSYPIKYEKQKSKKKPSRAKVFRHLRQSLIKSIIVVKLNVPFLNI